MERLKVAICGGGIASICLAHALINKHPRSEIKIFEANHVFREEGAAIGLGSNAQEALSLISPDLRNALDEAGGTQMDPSVRVMMGTGPDSGRHIGDISLAVRQIVVHRWSFWQALRKQMPDGILEMGKRLVDVDYSSEYGPIQLRFGDGTLYEADVLVGCDGINSITRTLILGADHPAANPVYTNGYVHRVVVPIDTAITAFGKEYCSLRTQHGWVGDGGFLLTDLVHHGEAMQVIAGWSNKEPWSHPAPFVEWPKERLKSDLAGWGHVGKAMTKIFTDQPKLYAAGGRIHLDTPTYCKGRICVAGDAAQTFPPFQGAGAGQAIEDVLILSTVLGACTTRVDIPRALEVYDALRRPRRADVARSSKWAAMLFTGRAPDVGLDLQRIAEKLPDWGSNIYNYDLAAVGAEGLQRMAQTYGVRNHD